MKRISFFLIISALLAFNGCSKKSAGDPDGNPPPIDPPPTGQGNADSDLSNIVITVDCNEKQGPVHRFEQANTTSTTSGLPGEKSKPWLGNLKHAVVRVWIQLRFVHHNGYNYRYSGSNVPVEDALAYYSDASDSLLVCLSAYNGTASQPMPAAGLPYQTLVKNTVKYYKTKFPKIKYIQIGNEPDYNNDPVDNYYTVYKDYYKGIYAANEELGLTGNDRLLVSNGPFTSVTNFNDLLPYAQEFLNRYAADTDPEKRLDIFSYHCYTENDHPKLLEESRSRIHNMISSRGLPRIPIFITESGLFGGDYIPSAWTRADAVTAQPAGQFAKMFYLYEGGIDYVFNWAVSHATITRKSELADLENGYAYPYGNALTLSRELSARETRIKATSTKIDAKGLGINAMASMGNNNGIAVLLWNYNFTANVPDQSGNIMITNIPASLFPGKIKRTIYLIDAKNNNIFNNASQQQLVPLREDVFDYNASVGVPVTLEKNAVALAVLTPM